MKTYKVEYTYKVTGWATVKATSKKEAKENLLQADNFGYNEEIQVVTPINALLPHETNRM